MKLKMICFDMDGTIADLYSVPDWLPKLRNFNPEPFYKARPMWDMKKLTTICDLLRTSGIEIRIVTWLSLETTPQYDQKVTKAKIEWLEKYGFKYNEIHVLPYGVSKSNTIKKYLKKDESAILIDDNAEVRADWSLRDTINPLSANILKILEKLSKNY